MQDQSLGREDPLEEGMATHSVFLPGESHGQRSLAGYSPWGCCCKESDRTEVTWPKSIFGCHNWRPVTSGWRPGMLINSLHCSGQLPPSPPQQRIIQSQMSIVLRLRSPGLGESCQVERSSRRGEKKRKSKIILLQIHRYDIERTEEMSQPTAEEK